jgi:hypothetical protein
MPSPKKIDLLRDFVAGVYRQQLLLTILQTGEEILPQ